MAAIFLPSMPLELGGDGGERLVPGRLDELAALADVRPVEALVAQAVDRVARLVGDPLLVHVVVEARQHAHHRAAARVDADVGAQRIDHVDRSRSCAAPRARLEGVGLGGQRADRAEVDQVAGELGRERLLDVGRDLHALAAAGRAQLLDAGHLGGEADAARALDAAVHRRLDQRPELLVGHGALVLVVAAAVEAVAHRLVLQVALAALVADRAVERMVDQQEFHHAVARLLHHRRVGEDLLLVGDRQRAARLRLGRAGLHLDQAHAAVAGDRQALVVAEARDLDAGHLAGLQDRDAGRHLDLLTVDLDYGHVCSRPYSAASFSVRARMRRFHLGPEVPDQSLDRPGRARRPARRSCGPRPAW